MVFLAALSTARVGAQAPPDTLQLPDTTQVVDPEQVPPDSISADTVFYNLPALDAGVPSGFATGVWEWDRHGIMASGANTLAELMQAVPGVIALYGGDYGTPLALTAFGLGAGGLRVFQDGFEVFPLDGGQPDLQRVGLAGIGRVRLDRSMGAMRIDLWSHRHDDGRPFSVIEAGTGDLDTNIFRGVFADPTALGGSVAVGLERADTRGIATDEGGNRTGSWARYQLHFGDRAGLALEYRGAGTQTKVPGYASRLSRRDVTLRGRIEITEGVRAEAYTGRSTLDAEEAGAGYELYGGRRAQHGGRLQVHRGEAWARGSFRLFGGDLPESVLDVDVGLMPSAIGGVSGGYSRSSWAGTSTSSMRGRAWIGPLAGVTVFGSWESGTYGGRDAPILDGMTAPPPPFLPQPADPPPGALVTDRTALRAGAVVSWRGVEAAGAFLSVENDVNLPLGTELDLGSPTEAGATRTGLEGWVSVPMLLDGLRLEGSYQRWDPVGPFLPEQVYRASFEYHKVHMESGNLELWWSLGVRGHDPMTVFAADTGQGMGGLVPVPFYQSWYGRIQVRVLTVRLFFGWENFTLRRNLQTFPDRRLPFARSLFALRWDMWN